ncbi:MAG: MBL fold metallo-hydrolase [Bacteroidales bacterium]|nr:MBL fold metallo-hydrolase [Bacteroidales bacterium]
MKSKNLFYYFLLLIIPLLSLSHWSYSQNPVTNLTSGQRIAENIYLLTDYGCNMVVMVGQEGLLIIDTGYKGSALKTDSVISTISNLPVKYVLNTHLHFDHVGGNMKLAEDGAVIIAHENTRKHMLSGWKVPEIQGINYSPVLPYSIEYLPKICFKDSLNIYFNNDVVQAIHYPNAHSDCDVIFYFQNTNVLHAGDLFESNGFPILDVWYGGTIDGYIKALDDILKICNDNTVIISGHGDPSNRQGLQDYRNMLVESRTRISRLIEEGKSVDEVIAADPTKDLYKGGESWIPVKLYVATVYEDLSRK